MSHNETERFSHCVDAYGQHRPGYPEGLLDRIETLVSPGARIADIGAGTGIMTQSLLDRRYSVVGVEPNAAMFRALERNFGSAPGFSAVKCRAESTGLAPHSVDAIVAAQAMHWFDAQGTHEEFRRILKPGGYVMAIWNERDVHATAFNQAWEDAFATYGTDYKEVGEVLSARTDLSKIFGHDNYACDVWSNQQRLDWAGLMGRIDSVSYAPPRDSADYKALVANLRDAYDAYAEQGYVILKYRTPLYYAILEGS